jgi:uncharacterized membrane protein YfcA
MIAKDKQLHLAAGAIVGFCAAIYAPHIHVNGLFLAVVVATLVGLAKELYDKAHPDKHTFDLMDAAYTAAGGFAGGIVGAMM